MRLQRLVIGGRRKLSGVWLLCALLVGSCGGSGESTAVASSPAAPERAEAGSAADRVAAVEAMTGRTIVGYQGWFGCPDERQLAPAHAPGGGANVVSPMSARWRHWFAAQVDDSASLTVEMLPDVSELPQAARCKTTLRGRDGSNVLVFSSADPAVVDLHFRWMKEHGIDGAAVQRFISDLRSGSEGDRSDAILRAIRDSAETHGRSFYITYDVSGADPSTVYDQIRADWQRLTAQLRITASSAYLTGQGRPLLQLWGFGFKDRPGDPQQVMRLMSDLRQPNGASGGALLIGGVPSSWRNANGDSRTGASWARVYRGFDVISPWAVGRYTDEASNQGFVDGLVVPDLEETARLGIGYLPVIFPGFSWANLMSARGNPSDARPNQVPRRCGNFLWQQGQTRLAAGVRGLFIAMFDEVDEGTAVMPVVARSQDLPAGTRLIALDQDGCDLPSDWYLRVSASLASSLRNGETPPKSLSAVLRP